MKFIDLFAGLGGFHLALKRLGHECVFACEKDEELRVLYEKNFGIKPEGNIKKLKIKDIPSHDILCAGFPCQPFSKATPTELRTGFDNPKQGDLFNYVIEILKAKKPRYFILENVLHIRKHDNEQTWKKIKEELENAGYAEDYVDEICLSPHKFGIPQIRRRVFIVGDREGPSRLLCEPSTCIEPDLENILDTNPPNAQELNDRQVKCLEVWQEFLDLLQDKDLPRAPIWSMEFGANYPFEEKTPDALAIDELRRHLGNHGTPLKDLPEEEIRHNLPAYAQRGQEQFPPWKIRFIKENRDFYEDNKDWIDEWKQKILEFPPSYQKFEWNCKGVKRDLWKIKNFVIQFRASGIRVKKATTAPSLVTMSVHVPIIGWEKRYMTQHECARLQGMACLPNEDHLKGTKKKALDLPETSSRAFTALGNAVNVDVVEHIAKALTSISGGPTNLEEQFDSPTDIEKD